MEGPGGVSDSRSAPVAERRKTGSPQGVERFGFEDLSWTDVADIVWLAAAISPRRAADGAEPAEEPERPSEKTRIRNAPAERGENPEPPESRPSRIVDTEVPSGDDGEVVGIEAVPGELPEPAVDGTGPGGVVLLESLEYFRALRSLKRETVSRRHNNVVLDEVATAVRVAETGRWWPVTRSRKERWLDLTLVLDNGPSMALWRPRVSAFVELLRQVGAFRTIQVRLLETAKDSEEGLVLRGGTPGAPARDPDEIVDSSGRRAVLLLTDGVGDAWQNKDALYPMLARWGRRMPVSIVHLLPPWLWGRCGMEPHKAWLRVPNALAPNSRWGCDLADAWLEPGSEVPGHLVPVPVLELRPRSLGWWAGLMTGENTGAVEGTVVLTTERISRSDFTDPPVTLSPAERVHRFRSVASPPALRLAQLLAAVPVRLDVAKLVGQRFVPEAGVEHLLELLLSGMMYAPALREGKSTWDTDGVFAFPEAVRELLLSGARRSETASVVRVAATHFGDRIRLLGHLRDAIADPNNTPDPDLTRESPADVELESVLMRALSGPYLSRADRLRNAVRGRGLVAFESESIKKAVSPKMPETAERPPASTPVPQGRSTYLSEPDANEPTTRIVHPSAVDSSRHFPDRQPDDPPLIFGNVPPRNPNFTGRDELLEQLTKRLSSGTTAVLPSALHGLGGIGKTQMAAEYIYRHLQDYDLVWWIDAAHTTQIRAGLSELAGISR
ncbi:SAV_2336 N-terminal domain-related protein [Amycolatopsis coloradensis]|uniref:SAV_2336 N-terminal domain-related protein n=1 Tax=Amycolatopsis coloradensis TaxID=76021 RepID=A0ACD5BPG2_9PSEU